MLHDKDLKATVAFTKANANARFGEIADIAEDREFWRKGKALVGQGRDTARALRAARNANLEHASPVLGSGLGKIGQAGDPGIGTPGRGPGALGGAGRGALILPSGVGRGARGADFVRGRGARGAGQRRPAPLPTLSLPASPPPARMAERPRRAAWQERAARSCALRRVRWSQRADLEHGHAQHCPLPKT